MGEPSGLACYSASAPVAGGETKNVERTTIPVKQHANEVQRPAGRGKRFWARILFVVLTAIVLSGCATVPVTQRQQLNLVSESSLTSASQQQCQEFLATHEVIRNTLIGRDRELLETGPLESGSATRGS